MSHTYHLVTPSPWPLLTSWGCLTLTTGGVMYMHSYQGGWIQLLLGLGLVLLLMGLWWRDVIRESTFQGYHTYYVQRGITWGMILFIVSEVMFFLAFFWAYFHSSLSPSIEIGCTWPPVGIVALDPWGVPLLNTIILLSSGATVTWSHHAIMSKNRGGSILSLSITIVLAIIFTYLQYLEYSDSSFTITDGVYGSTFFLATGFHGIHVIIGTLFLAVSLIRLQSYHFTCTRHLGFLSASWYFHFVDVVWLFLFISIYWWGSI